MPYTPLRTPCLQQLLASSALLLAACGGGAGESAPTATATVTPTTEAALSASAASAADPGASAASSASADAIASGVLALAKAQAAATRSTADTPGKTTTAPTTTGATSTAPTAGAIGSNSSSTTPSGTSVAAATTNVSTVPAGSTTASPTATLVKGLVGTTTAATPVVFNAPLSSAPGDVISLQGENFGSSPSVYLVDTTGKRLASLSVISSYAGGALTARLPSTATGALIVQVDNGGALSSPVKLNAARPYHLDALQISAGGQFRLFGRNLLSGGQAPSVSVDGLAAKVDIAKSDEHMLVLTAPASLKANARASIVVDNRNGSGPATLDRPVEAVVGKGTDPFGLGVGWGDGFSAIAGQVVNAATDSRLNRKVKCDGSSDDAGALQDSIALATKLGGAVVQLPAGTCVYTQSLALASKVVVRGAGKGKTTLRYAAANPGAHALWAKSQDLLGLADLSVDIAKANTETSNLQGNRRLFVKNVSLSLNGGIQMFWKDNTNFAVVGTDIVQPVNDRQNGPLYMGNNSGLSFTGNTITFAHGSPSIPRCSDAYLASNRITRDVRNAMNASSIVHSLAMDFAHRVAIIGNTFDVLGGPITNKTRNDGETLLTEGGALNRTENIGTVTSATASTLVDTNNTLNVMPFNDGQLPPNYGVAIVSGKGAGQHRRVTGYSGKTLSLETAWDVIPDSSSRYATFVWGLEKALIKNNTLKDNPRGIWIYQTAARDVDIVGNTITEGGGIYVRAGQLTSSKLFTPIFGIRIAKNSISNTTRQWSSYVNINFTRMDASDFGYAVINTEIRQNQLTANSPNLIMNQELSTSSEGYEVIMLGEGSAQSLLLSQARLLGTVFQSNSCRNCNRLIGTSAAAYATAIDANQLTN